MTRMMLAATVLVGLASFPQPAAAVAAGGCVVKDKAPVRLAEAPGGCVVANAEGPAVIREPWVREAPPQASAMAAYMTIENVKKTPLKLTGARSPQFAKVEIHEIVTENGMARMQEVKALSIAPGGKLVLEPGSTHVMLIGPKKPLPAGAPVELTLLWAGGGKTLVKMAVRPREGHEHHHHDHDHHDH
ncbi:MAG: copper chaperone PCu(A)C [Candidatus Sericytochromatia bacterium]|nr:copper chaperone PCu(A)C [Candidatus Sericytochromatia bacterium]